MFRRIFSFNRKREEDKINNELQKSSDEIKKCMQEALNKNKTLEASLVGNPLLISSYEIIKNNNISLEQSIEKLDKPVETSYVDNNVLNEVIKTRLQESINKTLDLQESIKEMNTDGRFDECIDTIKDTVKKAIETNEKML